MIMEYYYIKDGRIEILNFELSASKYDVGTTYEDAIQGKYVRLNDGQIEFMKNNNTNNIYNVWYMSTTVINRTLEQAKVEMLNKITEYDNSEDVNSFTFNGIKCWFDTEQRRGYAQSILSCKTLQVETIQVPIGNTIVTMKVSDADIMLAKVHLYADNCFMVTLQHKNTVNNLTTIEEVDSFDYKSGYPDKLVFTS